MAPSPPPDLAALIPLTPRALRTLWLQWFDRPAPAKIRRELRFPPLFGQVVSDNTLMDLGLVSSFRTGFFSRCCFPQKPAGRRGRDFGHMPAPDDAPGSLIRGDPPSVHT
jgi:hypothetical protein